MIDENNVEWCVEWMEERCGMMYDGGKEKEREK